MQSASHAVHLNTEASSASAGAKYFPLWAAVAAPESKISCLLWNKYEENILFNARSFENLRGNLTGSTYTPYQKESPIYTVCTRATMDCVVSE